MWEVEWSQRKKEPTLPSIRVLPGVLEKFRLVPILLETIRACDTLKMEDGDKEKYQAVERHARYISISIAKSNLIQ